MGEDPGGRVEVHPGGQGARFDQHFQRAAAAGAEILRPPTDEDYGQRKYGLRDCEGHDWQIATPTEQPAAR
jgi:uncharacterized glyoxalase superfamily protein PhnB